MMMAWCTATFTSSSITLVDLQEETAKLDYITAVIKG